MRWIAYVLPLALFLVLVGFFLRGLGIDPARVPSPLIGKPAPEFALPALDSRTVGVTTEALKGRPSLINFFASWCVPCRLEHPLLMAVAARRDIAIIGIAYKDKPEDARRWVETYGDPYERIAADADGRAAIDWGVYGVPESYVVDRGGIIRYKQIGPLSQRDMEETVLPLLKELSR
ncbi:MAG: DsbE family thiol:disulfide interchange protein [Alphaproteobacteria bacterium]